MGEEYNREQWEAMYHDAKVLREKICDRLEEVYGDESIEQWDLLVDRLAEHIGTSVDEETLKGCATYQAAISSTVFFGETSTIDLPGDQSVMKFLKGIWEEIKPV